MLLLLAGYSAAFAPPATHAPSSALLRAPPRVCTPRMGLVRQVTTAEFEEAIQDCATPIILDVFAVWCGPCQLMAPELEKVAEKLGDKVRILKIDADEEPVVASTLRVQGLPTVMFINDMSVVMRAEGALMEDELMQLADHHLCAPPASEPTRHHPAVYHRRCLLSWQLRRSSAAARGHGGADCGPMMSARLSRAAAVTCVV